MANETIASEELEVTAAEREAAEHARKASELERRVAEGHDGITADEIEKQHGLARFAKLRAAGARRKAELAEQARTVQARKDLRVEIEKATVRSGAALAGLLKAADTAIRAFTAAADEHDNKVHDWKVRLGQLDVPSTGYALPDFQGLGHSHTDVLAGDRVISRIGGARYLGAILAAGENGSIWPREQDDPNDPVAGRKRIDRACSDLDREVVGRVGS